MSGKILIVDREPQTVRRAQAAAKACGMGAVVASTTAYALQLLGTERPDVVLFDLSARDGSWVSLVKSLRELDPEIAIVATGTSLSMDQVMEAMRHRISDVLEKPLAEEHLTASIQRIQRARAAVSPSATIDVVLVDDDPMTLSFASRQLSSRGVIARTVGTVRAARAEILGRRPEAVVIDVVLAGESGLDLLPELAAAVPPIPAILITASADPRVAITGLRGGAFSAFPKPLDWDAIYRSIVTARRWVAQHTAGVPSGPLAHAQVGQAQLGQAQLGQAQLAQVAQVAQVAAEPTARPAPPPPQVFHPQYHAQSLVSPPLPPEPLPASVPEPAPVFDPRAQVEALAPAPAPPAVAFDPRAHVETLASAPLPPPAPVFEPQYVAEALLALPAPPEPPALPAPPAPTEPPEPAAPPAPAPIVFEPRLHVELLESAPLPPEPPPAPVFEPRYHVETLDPTLVETFEHVPVFEARYIAEALLALPAPPAPPPPPPARPLFDAQFHAESLITLPPAPRPAAERAPVFDPRLHVAKLDVPPPPAPRGPIFEPQYHLEQLVNVQPDAPVFEPRYHVETLVAAQPAGPTFLPQYHLEQMVAVAPAGPVFEPQYHLEQMVAVAPEPVEPPAPAEAPPAPGPVFEPQYHLEQLVGAEPEPSAFDAMLHAEALRDQVVVAMPEDPTLRYDAAAALEALKRAEAEPEPPKPRHVEPLEPPPFRVRTHCHVHYTEERPHAPDVVTPPLPALSVAQNLGKDDLASQALARAALALASLPSGILILDHRPAVVELNPAAEELLGLPRDRALDGGREELPHLTPFFDAARLVLDSGNGRFFQEAALVLPRGPRTMGFGAVPLQKGQKEGVLIYFQDITTRRGAASQRRQTERLASLGMIAAGLTAELADPISMAATYADLITKESNSIERCHHHAGRLKTALNRTTQLASYVTTLLHRPPSEPGPVEMHDVISGVSASLQRKLLLGNRPALLELGATVPLVMGEAIDFEHMVLTVLVSANQALQRGGDLHIATRNHTGIFEMVVEAREVSPDATDPGAKPLAEPPDVAPALEIVRSLVKRYGGAVRVDSGAGVKRRFTLRLLPARPEQCAGWAVMGFATPPLTTIHLKGQSPVGLLVQDDLTREQVYTWLDDAGVFVLAAETEDEALDAIHKLKPTVMIVQGPPQDGKWLAFLRKAAEPHLTAIVSLLDQGVSPRMQADLDELPGHRSMRWPVDRLPLLQALAMAELDGLDLQVARASGQFTRPGAAGRQP